MSCDLPSGWVFHPKCILSALLLSDELGHFWVVPKEAQPAGHTAPLTCVSHPGWDCGFGGVPSGQRSLHGLQLSIGLCLFQYRHPKETPAFPSSPESSSKTLLKMQPLSEIRMLKSNSFKTPVQDVGQALLNPCLWWPCLVPGKGNPAQQSLSRQPLLPVVCVADTKLARPFAGKANTTARRRQTVLFLTSAT